MREQPSEVDMSGGHRIDPHNVPIACSFLLILLAVLLVNSTTNLGQETTGGLQGIVMDPSGARLPGVKLEVTSPSLVRSLAVISDSAGAYYLPSLPPGDCVLTGTMNGFRTFQQQGIHLQVGK